jgi:hypothetical protein
LAVSCGAKTPPFGSSGSEHDGAPPVDDAASPDARGDEDGAGTPADAIVVPPGCGTDSDDRCNAQGRRETCGTDGEWHETDYVCTINVAVDDETASYCATKADGRYKCWGSLPAESLPDAKYVRVQLAREGLVGLTNDGRVLTAGFEVPPDLPVVAQFRATNMFGYQAICYRSATDGSFGMFSDTPSATPLRVLDPGPFADVTCAFEGLACGAKQDGSVWCNNSGIGMLPNGHYGQIALSLGFVCGFGNGRVACAPGYANASAPAPGFAPTTYRRIAVTNGVACALTFFEDIGCLRADWTYIPVDSARYSFMDAGRNVLCAIRRNGTSICWQHEEVPADVTAFRPVSPPIDPDW